MFNFKDNDQKLASGLLVASLVAMLGALVFKIILMTGHGPTTVGLDKKAAKVRSTTEKAITKARDVEATSKETLSKILWKLSPEEVTAKMLNKVSELSQVNKLKLLSFRPLRQLNTPDVIELPWQVTVDGSFKDVIAFERTIEKPENQVAINLVQIAGADASSDRVTATIGVLAFVEPAAPVETKEEKAPKKTDTAPAAAKK